MLRPIALPTLLIITGLATPKLEKAVADRLRALGYLPSIEEGTPQVPRTTAVRRHGSKPRHTENAR